MGMAGTGMRYPLKKYGFNTALALKRFIIAIRLYNYDTHRKHMLAAQRDISGKPQPVNHRQMHDLYVLNSKLIIDQWCQGGDEL